jgi:hypothetical protein
MADNRQETEQPDLSNPAARHEGRDVNVWAVGKFGIALLFLCGLSLLLLAGLFKYFAAQEGGAVRPGGMNEDARRLPPEPRLQDAPIKDLQEMREAEDRILNSYGWLDQQAGTVHIPVSRAMQLVVARGLPARQGQFVSATTATVPTESGLGYVMQQPGGPLAGEPAVQPPNQPPPPRRESYPVDTAMPGANPPPKYYEAPKK